MADRQRGRQIVLATAYRIFKFKTFTAHASAVHVRVRCGTLRALLKRVLIQRRLTTFAYPLLFLFDERSIFV